MNMTVRDLVQSAVDTIRDPRQGARDIMALNLTRRKRWDVLFLVVVLSAVMGQLTYVLTEPQGSSMAGPLPANPFTLGIVQLVLLVVMVFGIHFIGSRFGGNGSFDDAILLVAWLQFIMIVLQVVQTVFLFVMPPVALFIGLGGLVLFFWLMANFIAELHGFKSMGAVMVGIVLSMVAFAVVLSVVLGFFGVFPEGVQ